MNRRLMGVLLFALVVSSVASYVLYRLVSARLAAQAKPPGKQLYIATRNLPIGTLIKDFDVKLVDWQGTVSPHAISKPEDILGRGVVADIVEGEPVLDSRLAAKGAGAGLAAIVPTGKRAVAMRVNDVSSLSGYVIPGSRVDILILGNPPGATGNLGTATKTLLQNMEVLSAGQQIQKDAEGKPIPVAVVTILVTPEQAEILSLASSDARIQLILRNPLDKEETKPPGTVMARLWSGQGAVPTAAAPGAGRPRVVPPPKPAPRPVEKEKPVTIIVEVIQGAARSQARFEQKSEKPEEK